jgi:transposase-like protein
VVRVREKARDCLGLWVAKRKGARFWTNVMTELRNRGVKDVFSVCMDSLTGLTEAIDAVFPLTVNQTCIVRLVRQSLRYLSWKERKHCAAEQRRIYTATDADKPREVLDELVHEWSESKTRTAWALSAPPCPREPLGRRPQSLCLAAGARDATIRQGDDALHSRAAT